MPCTGAASESLDLNIPPLRRPVTAAVRHKQLESYAMFYRLPSLCIIPLLFAFSQSASGGIVISTESWGGNIYHLIAKDIAQTPQTWAEAEAFSTSLGGNLVSI